MMESTRSSFAGRSRWRRLAFPLALCTLGIALSVPAVASAALEFERAFAVSDQDLEQDVVVVGGKAFVAITGRGHLDNSVKVYDTGTGALLDSWDASGGRGLGPAGISSLDGKLYVIGTRCAQAGCDEIVGEILVFSQQGMLRDRFGSNKLQSATGIDVSGRDVYVSDPVSTKINVYRKSGKFLRSWGGNGPGGGGAGERRQGANGELSDPQGIAVADDGRSVFVAEPNEDRVQRFEPDGEFISKWSVEAFPYGIATTGKRIYVGNSGYDEGGVIGKFNFVGELLETNEPVESSAYANNLEVVGDDVFATLNLVDSGSCLCISEIGVFSK